MCERILAQNCQKFDNFNFEFSMSHHNAHYQSYKNAPVMCEKQDLFISLIQFQTIYTLLLQISKGHKLRFFGITFCLKDCGRLPFLAVQDSSISDIVGLSVGAN